MTQQGILYERLEALDRSRRGHLSVISRVCSELDECLKDFSNLVKVRSRQIQLNAAWEQYCACCDKYADLLDTSCEKYQRVSNDRAAQHSRIRTFTDRIEQFVENAAVFYNNQVSEEVRVSKKVSPPGSVKSVRSHCSQLSMCSSKAREAKAQAARAALVQQQAEEMSRKVVELEKKRIEMEITRTELEYRLELTKLEAEREVAAARNKAELASLEATLAEGEEARFEDKPHEVQKARQHDIDPVNNPQQPPTFTGVTQCLASEAHPPHTSTPMADGPHPSIPKPCNELQASVKFPAKSEDVKTGTDMSQVQGQGNSQQLPQAFAVETSTPYTPVSTYCVPQPSTTGSVVSESLIAIMSSMERMSASYDLPHVQVQRFDGSPEKYPAFRQRFRQMVETRPLDDSVKMARLLQFLEGPALTAVQRYEPLPNGLTRALKTLEERFGQPFQVVRAFVESLTKGPAIQATDKVDLQLYADTAQITYDTLESMGYLSEMNSDNLEKVIARLPKWMQAKFAERLNGLERKGQVMPSFKDVVEFLKERAYVSNHPFFSGGRVETMTPRSKPTSRGVTSRVSACATTTAKQDCCPMCYQSHRLYRCDLFKSKSPQERSDFVKQKQICFNCINSTSHNSKKCTSSTRCKVQGCGKTHHTLLHFTGPTGEARRLEVNQSEDVIKQDSIPDQATTSTCSAEGTFHSCEVLLQVVPIRVMSEAGNQITTYGLVDSGSDITMIDSSLVKLLNIKGSTSKLSLTTVNSFDSKEEGLKVNFKIAPVDNTSGHVVNVKSAWAVKDLTIPLKHTRVTKSLEQWPHLKYVYFPEVERKKISALLGTNVQEAFIPLEVKKGKPNEPLAIKSCIGWSILGGSSARQACRGVQVNLISGDVSLSHQLEEFWKIELYGTTLGVSKAMSVEDRRALKQIDYSICKVDGHYQMALLWKDDNPALPYNRALAKARLQHLKRRFERDPNLETKYRAVIDECVAKGYARKLVKEEAATVSNITWYLPHHPVINPNKPGKVRVVFDAAARFQGTSLNDKLLQGPSLTSDLTGVLLRFRQDQVAFSADIEGMFYQTKVRPADTDALRFLWWSGSIHDPPEEYKMLVHIFGAKSSPCCAIKALNTSAEDNKAAFTPDVIETVRRNFYVDDVLKSVPSTKKAITLTSDLTKLLKEGGFNLTKFTSNSREVLASIPPERRANPKLDLDLDQLPLERALGVYWDAQSDAFKFRSIKKCKPHTKRGLLSITSSLYDPLGFIAPFVFSAKVLLQELWRQKLPWDHEIPEPYLSEWQRWLEGLPQVITADIPRCYKAKSLGVSTTLQLHNFADASRSGYAAVSYLRFADEQGRVHCSFVMGKTRNAPVKELTIPRLELQAAVLTTRLKKMILRELDLPIDKAFMWSDSKTVLQYIANQTKRFHTFVSNRVAEIHETTSPEQWRHVPGEVNPADDGSRGVCATYFQSKCPWWSGPEFLWQPEDKWPQTKVEDLPDDDKEIRNFQTVTFTTDTSVINFLLQRYSSWSVLLRIVSWVLRFVKYVRKEKPTSPLSSTLSLKELEQARNEVVRFVQRQHFYEEYLALNGGGQVKCHSKLANLSPILSNGLIRVGGRIHRAPIAFEAAHPVILPKAHPVTALIVRYYHHILGHAGREHVLSVMRQRFWILRGRSLVREIVNKCISCRRRNASTMQQTMADLPKERLVPYQPPFTYTGIDFFGPFHVKRARSSVKVYGCIFVCFNSRAVHIEDASSLETDTFIQALRRFLSVRGCPKEIWSDNGTNFTGAEKELRRSVQDLNEERIKRELYSREVEWYQCALPKWRFQPPAASHMSGVWERLIRSVRRVMNAILGNQSALVGLETLRTIFAEVVSILNSRPICPASDDTNDLDPLTPNHFLLQRQNLLVPPGVFSSQELFSRKQWRHAQFLTNCFWSRWIREYVPTSQQRHKWLLNRRNLAVNDLVLVVDNTAPRCRWLLGRVMKVFPGEDARVRSAEEVKTKHSKLIRPITKLCLLEEAR